MVQTQISAQKSSVRLCKLGSSYFDGAEQLSPEQKAQELANQAVELLNALKEAKALDALKTAKALQFVFYGQGGIIVSRIKGNGFSLLRKADGTWSAPLLLNLDTFSLGFTLGFKDAAHLVLAVSDEASKLLAEQGALRGKGAAAKLTVGTVEKGAEHEEHDVVALRTDAGLLLNVSAPVPLLTGDLSADANANQELYGVASSPYDAANVDWPARVLRGEGGAALPPPVQFNTLYERLAELAA